MKHFIATRFNLKVTSWKTSKDGSTVLTEDWLKQRFMLFEKYCLPSVLNQTNKNYFWFIFFEVDTPAFYKNRINTLTQGYDNIIPKYIKGLDELNDFYVLG